MTIGRETSSREANGISLPGKVFSALAPLILGLVVLTALNGCSLVRHQPRPRHYYQIHYTPRVSSYYNQYDYIVRIKPFDVDRIYRRHNIVYRTSQFELFYYNSHFWAVRPADMMSDVLASHVEATGLFQEVLRRLDKMPRYELTGRILALDEITSGDRQFARASMMLTMTDFRTNEVVASHFFDRRKEVFNREPVYTVRALSEVIEEETSLFMRTVNDALSESP